MIDKAYTLNMLREKGKSDAEKLQVEAATGVVTQTEIIRRESAVPEFDPQKDYTSWPVNAPVSDEGQVWLLLQPYNAANYTGRPSTLRALWGLAHTTDVALAKPYVAPYGTSGMYMIGECCLWEEAVYISTTDNNVWTPTDYPQGWSKAE